MEDSAVLDVLRFRNMVTVHHDPLHELDFGDWCVLGHCQPRDIVQVFRFLLT